MDNSRLAGFSDGVIAIIITIMVLGLEAPEGNTFIDLMPQMVSFIIYIVSFIIVAIFWNNHHYMVSLVKKVDNPLMWRNSLFLLSISFIPFATDWLGKNLLSPDVIMFYGIVLFFSSASFTFLQIYIVRQVENNLLEFSVFKGKVACVWVLIGIVIAHFHPILGLILLAMMTLIWLTPNDIAEALSLFDNPYVDDEEARSKYNSIKDVIDLRVEEHNKRIQKKEYRKEKLKRNKRERRTKLDIKK